MNVISRDEMEPIGTGPWVGVLPTLEAVVQLPVMDDQLRFAQLLDESGARETLIELKARFLLLGRAPAGWRDAFGVRLKSECERRGIAYECDSMLRVVQFLRQIGLGVQYRVGAAGFLERLEIVDGTLHVDPRCPVSDLLHEAGHLAVLPGNQRRLVTGDTDTLYRYRRQFGAVAVSLPPDAPYVRALLQGGEPEATAWSWAAGAACSVPGDEVIRDQDFEGEGADIRTGLQLGMHLGINGLFHGGMLFAIRGRDGFPKMKRWIQPSFDPISGEPIIAPPVTGAPCESQ